VGADRHLGNQGAPVKIAFGHVQQETCTFNPVATTLDRFAAMVLLEGEGIIEERGSKGGMVGGFVTTLRDRAELIPTISAQSLPGGRLSADTLGTFADGLIRGLEAAGDVDGVGLLLHGASAAEGDDDVEGYLLRVARQVVGDDIPIVVGLDHHANITARMMRLATAIVGHRTQPHDQTETGQLVADLLARTIAGEVAPVMTWRKLALLSHQEQYLTSQAPMKTWFDRARDHEAASSPVISVSPFPMQPWLDVDEGGWSVVVVADASADEALSVADDVADELADLAWSLREEFQVTSSVSPADAVARAAEHDGFSLISDTGDSVFGGAGGDSTTMLAALLEHGEVDALVPVVQPAIAELFGEVTVGDHVSLDVGGSVTGWWPPLPVDGVVVGVGAPHVTIPGSGFDSAMDMGPSVAIRVANVTIVVSARPGVAGNHPDHYTSLGVDVAAHQVAVVKTASNFQFYAHLTDHVIRANTPGPTQSDIRALPWGRVPRPIYPLDDVADWRRHEVGS